MSAIIKYGLIGYPLTHSFSKKYFSAKFERLNLNEAYELFPLENINELSALLEKHKQLIGLNVTIPYKQSILPFLQKIDDTAAKVGAVNTVKIIRNSEGSPSQLIGYNTDVYGFRESIKPFLETSHTHALILGSGGAAKAVKYVLERLGVNTFIVSRTASNFQNHLTYKEINKNVLDRCKLIINTTPLGMHPSVENFPEIPYEFLNEQHFLYDLIYNPEETFFLKKGKQQGCTTLNGLSMFHFQAEKSWEIWNT